MKNENPTVLLVNADESISTVFSYNLERYGFVVNLSKSGSAALMDAARVIPQVIVIDDNINNLGHEKLSATQIATIFRSKSPTKSATIIFLTEEKEPSYHADLADIILKKPFSASELVKKIRELFQEVKPQPNQRYLEYKDLKLNVGTYKVTRNGKTIHLGPTEFKILQCLMELPNKVLSREHIMNQVWGFNSGIEPRTIDVHINRLRTALNNDNNLKPVALIRTVRAAGYCLSAG